MKTSLKLAVVAVLIVAVWIVMARRESRRPATDPTGPFWASSPATASSPTPGPSLPAQQSKIPRLVDLGAGKCIPCKLMAPILEELKTEYAGRFEVVFIDVWQNPEVGKQYGIEIIPTQIFYDASGKELFRHVGFFGKEDILAKWKELGVDLGGKPSAAIVREAPLQPDTRPRDAVCFLCDGDVNAKTRALVRGQSEQRILCSPHCYFIYFSSLVNPDTPMEEAKVSVTDWTADSLVLATSATFLYGLDDKGRPTVQAFGDRAAAVNARQTNGGNLLTWDALRAKELATRCGFCDRAVYPEDACKVTVGGSTRTYGCCTHCALGVAARLQQDIEVEAKDGFSGELIRVKTLSGSVASLEPSTAIAWFGQKKDAEGKWVSAGCFKQGFFVSAANLQKWLEARPAMTGRQITIAQALADKMKLSPEQIAKACKLGECK
ncbi:MAG: hypothetical protein HYY24_28425 [Verrucomicrobia bacterium]|nr:hypothetical protein [Verrucomicrobiota bacterium]